MQHENRVKLAVWMVAAIAGIADVASAQYYRGGNGGRLLERDLGVYNSGGLQGRDLNASFRFAQNVALGRAGGGFSFMGDLGTQDYSDFVGGLGSNDLSEFRNRSQGSSLAGRGVRASDTASYIQSLTAGTRRPNAFKGTYEMPRSSYSKDFNFDTSPDFTGLPGIGTTGNGRNRNANGLLTDPLRSQEQAANRSLGLAGGRSHVASKSMTDPYGSTQLSARSRSETDLGTSDTLGGSLTGRGLDRTKGGVGIKGLPDVVAGGAARGDDDLASPDSARRATAKPRPNNAALGGPKTNIETRVPTGSAALDRPGGTQAVDYATSYDQLIQRLDKIGAGAKPDTDLNGPAPSPVPGAATRPTDRPADRPADRTGDRPTTPGLPDRPRPDQPRVTEPDSTQTVSDRLQQLRSRMLKGTDADTQGASPSLKLKPVNGLIGGTDWLARKSSTLAQNGVVLSSQERMMRDDARVRSTVPLPGQDIKPPSDLSSDRKSTIPDVDPETLRAIREAGGIVDTLVPSGTGFRDLYAEHIKRGQEQIKRGQYFQADDSFTQAAGIKSDSLAAQVGRIHAQIGGAVFRTAANQMRRLLRIRPEASGVHYAADLLPDKDRLEQVTIRLREISAWSGQPARDASLLLAYVGYQTRDASVVSEGLSRLEKLADPSEPDTDIRDGVIARFLRGVWVVEEPPASPATPAGADKPAPNPADDRAKAKAESPGQ